MKERKKMINNVSNVSNSKDIEIIIDDFLKNNPIDNDTLYNDNENKNFVELILHVYSQFNDIKEDVIEDIKDFDGYKAYLAGPPKMVEAAEKLFILRGIRKVDMHSDAFYTPYDQIEEVK